MGKTLYLDCSSGISGDMTVAALLDLGASEQRLRETLSTLPAHGYDVAVTRVRPCGLRQRGWARGRRDRLGRGRHPSGHDRDERRERAGRRV